MTAPEAHDEALAQAKALDDAPWVNPWHRWVNQDYDGRSRRCTLGLHPGSIQGFGNCADGDFAARQCCVYTPCHRHKCGPRKGCNCPLPATDDGSTAR